MMKKIVQLIGSISHPRFFETERGYQGELLRLLGNEVAARVWPSDAVAEQEYQKTFNNHGIRKRPDIIIHRPTVAGQNRTIGNYVVIELKLRGNAAEAKKAFLTLDEVLSKLNYPLGIFVNICSHQSHGHAYTGPFRKRLHFIAVTRKEQEIIVHREWFDRGRLRTATSRNSVTE